MRSIIKVATKCTSCQFLTLVFSVALLLVEVGGHQEGSNYHGLTIVLSLSTKGYNGSAPSLRRCGSENENLHVPDLTRLFKSKSLSELRSILEWEEEAEVKGQGLVLIFESPHIILLGSGQQIRKKFLKHNCSILISESNHDLRSNPTTMDPIGVIGFRSAILKLLNQTPGSHLRTIFNLEREDLVASVGLKVKVDSRSTIFQSIKEDLEDGIGQSRPSSKNHLDKALKRPLKPTKKENHHPKPTGVLTLSEGQHGGKVSLLNSLWGTRPLILMGSEGPVSTSLLVYYGNYLCDSSSAGTSSEKLTPESGHFEPKATVLLSIFIPRPVPFLDKVLSRIFDLNYPKELIHLRVVNGSNLTESNQRTLKDHLETFGQMFASVQVVQLSPGPNGRSYRAEALESAHEKRVDFYFSVDSGAVVDNPETLKLLIQEDKRVVTPLLGQTFGSWSNYWGGLSWRGKQQRSPNYLSVVKGVHRGLWSVPCVSSVYLVRMSDFGSGQTLFQGSNKDSSTLCTQDLNLTTGEWPFYLSNQVEFGHLILSSPSTPPLDLYQAKVNRLEWEEAYLHPNWNQSLDRSKVIAQPCPDVFWFPVFTPRFCSDLIHLMEDHGGWTIGTNYKPRDGEEHPNPDPYPTVDIDLERVGLDDLWVHVVRTYILPIRRRVFSGRVIDPPVMVANLVIRYRAEEQSSNQPHHDASTYTLNIALNRPGIDFTGGGCRFIRQNCSVTQGRVGWGLMHPGELTHYHEGMSTTGGSRYILVSFIDPRDYDD